MAIDVVARALHLQTIHNTVRMKAFLALAIGLQAVTAKVSYDGYKVYHIETSDYEATESALSSLEYVSLNCESDHKTLEVAVAPESLDAFKKLGLNAELTISDLGTEIATEGDLKPYKGRPIGHTSNDREACQC